MTRDDVIRMAKDAGMFAHKEVQPELHRFAALVAAAEREECAQIIENIAAQYTEPTWAYQILRAIRED